MAGENNLLELHNILYLASNPVQMNRKYTKLIITHQKNVIAYPPM